MSQENGHVVMDTKDARCRGATPTALHLEQLTLSLYDAYDRRDFHTPLKNFICPTVSGTPSRAPFEALM